MITCQFEDGHPVLLRHAVVGTIVVNDGKVLLARRSNTVKFERGKLCIPGGYMDRDESITQAMAREVLEETGYEITVDKLLTVFDESQSPWGDRQNIVFYGIGRLAKTEPVAKPDHETVDVLWAPLDQLPSDSELAFNHGDMLTLYKRHLAEEFPLPYLPDIQ